MDIVSMEFHEKNYFKSPIRTIIWGRPNNSLHETYFKWGDLNQYQHF